jgi:hypothetical protein
VGMSGHLNRRAAATPQAAAEIFQAAITTTAHPGRDAKVTADGPSGSRENNDHVDKECQRDIRQPNALGEEVHKKNDRNDRKRFGSRMELVCGARPGK